MIVVCLKWVQRRPDVDPLTGEVSHDVQTSGASDADLAALEWALRLADVRRGPDGPEEVVAVSAGPHEADALLRDAVAAGASRAVRVDLPHDAASAVVSAGLAAAAAGATVALCGDWSLDRGSGSVPAYLAARLGAAQALGLTSIEPQPDGSVRAQRRLDGGRREQVQVRAPMVLSVEGGVRLRRAPLEGMLRAQRAVIDVVPGPAATPVPPALSVGPYRPRARALAAPPAELSARDRILSLTGALVDRQPPEQVVLEPAAAADRILAQLRAWGYLGPAA